MLFRNISTGAEMNVSNVSMKDGRVFFSVRGKGCGKKFYNRNVCVTLDEEAENGTYLKCEEGWEVVNTPKRAKKEKKAEHEAVFVEQTNNVPEPTHEEVVNVETTEEENQQPKAPAKSAGKTATAKGIAKAEKNTEEDDARQLAAIFARMKGGNVDEDKIREIVRDEMQSIAPRKIVVVTATGENHVEGVTCKNYRRLCNIISTGKPVYMYGPAGCGKSYTAKQIAEGLGLDYYETSQAMFAHELKGYGDYKGEFVETSFSKAFVKGGLFFLDEVDASAPEALVVLNNAIANRRFDFPVLGNVTAHKDFRVIAAGNTKMTGATLEYTARQMQDTSFKNRFFFEQCNYDDNIMLQIAGGDVEITTFGADLRRAAHETGISQLFSYRQCEDLATLQECCEGDDAYLLRGSVLQEKTVDDALNLYSHLKSKDNRWAKAMKVCIEQMNKEEVW